ncbi:hypothetical protein JNW90_13795 [Micromonospora sp. STR1s_5]|nr:hypothetical protein [Micromonospora sp. STR1s_5]
MVGFQYPLKDDFPDTTQTPTAGLIKPSVEKFFIEIKKIAPRKYTVHSEHNMVGSETPSETPYDFVSLSSRFRLYANNSFVAMHNFGNHYMFYGKCEKIS